MNRTLRITILVALALMMGFSATGHVDRALGWGGLNHLDEANREYLDASFDRSLELFAVLSGVKVGLAVVEGSEIGVGFGIELGDVVQSVYDHVDIAWRTVLLGAVLLKGTAIVLDTAGVLGRWFLTPALSFIFFMLVLRWFAPRLTGTRRMARDGSLFFFIAATALYITLPLSVTGGRLLSSEITAPSLKDAEQKISQMERDLDRMDPRKEDEGWLSSLGSSGDKLKEFTQFLERKTSEIMTLLFTIITVYLFDCILFPLALFLIMVWSTRWIGQYLLGIRKTRDFREDLARIIHKPA